MTPSAMATAEAAILACLLVYPDKSAGYAGETFNPQMFSAQNAVIFNAVQKVFATTGTCDRSAVAKELEIAGQLAIAGGMSRLYELEMEAVPPILLPEYAKLLRDELARRRMVKLFNLIGPQLAENMCSVGDIIAQTLAEVEAIGSGRIEHSAPTMASLIGDAIKNIQDRATGLTVGVSTGLPCLDRVTGGIRPGSQWIIAGPAKGGKSSLALTMLASLAVEHKRRCALFGLEMPSVETVERLLCHSGRVAADGARDGKLNEHQIAQLGSASMRLAGAPIHMRDDLFELVEIVSCVRQIQSAYRDLFAVFVDYAQLVGASKPGENREREVATVSRMLRKLSMTTGIAVILLSQTNDDGKLRESRALGMDATKIVTIDFGESPRVRKLRLIQRDGISMDNLQVAYNGQFFEFADLAKNEPN